MALASSVMRSEPAGTLYSNSMVAWMGHWLSRMRRSTSPIGVSASPKGVFGPVPVPLPVLLVVSAEMQPAPHNFTVFPVAADLSAANMTRWLAAASARLVRAMSLPESSASKKAWNWV
jgi:hypothetical protein